jgi:hypothetical protein
LSGEMHALELGFRKKVEQEIRLNKGPFHGGRFRACDQPDSKP